MPQPSSSSPRSWNPEFTSPLCGPGPPFRPRGAGIQGESAARKYWEGTEKQSISLASCWWDNGLPSWTSRHLGWKETSPLLPLKLKGSEGSGHPDSSQPQLARTRGCVFSALEASCAFSSPAQPSPVRQGAQLLEPPLNLLLGSIWIFTPIRKQGFKF